MAGPSVRRAPLAGVVGAAAIATSLLMLGLAYQLTGPGVSIAFASGAVYLLLGLWMWHVSQIHFLLLLPFYFEQLTAIVSNVYLERGTYIMEQYRDSFATGSTLRLTAYMGLFLGAMFLTLRFLAPAAKLRALATAAQATGHIRLVSISILGVTCLWLLLLLGSGAVFGFPVFLGQNRFSYWSTHPFPYLLRVLIQGMQISFLLGVAYGVDPSRPFRRSILLIFALILGTNVLYGDKFSSSLLALMHFVTAAAVMSQLRTGVRLQLLKLAPPLLIVGGLFFLLVSWSYREISNIASEEVVNFIVARAFALQGHTWWGIDLLVNEGQADGVQVGQLFQRHSPESPGGLYLLMFAIAPARSVLWYMSQGMTFTMGGPAIAIYTLGYLMAIPYVLLAGVVTGMVLSYLAAMAARVHLWRAWIALKIAWIALLAFDMGNAYLLFGLSMGLYLFIVLTDVLQRSVGSRPSEATA